MSGDGQVVEARPMRGQPTALVRIDPQALISQALGAGASVETLRGLFELAKEVQAEVARQAWSKAMADFQAQCPKILKVKKAKILTQRAQYTYSYAPLDEIMGNVQPVMGPLGLSVSWETEILENAVSVEAFVMHELGHKVGSGKVVMPIEHRDPGDKSGASPPQRVGIALTYAKRYATLGILGIAPEDEDTDGQDKEPGEGRQGHEDGDGQGQADNLGASLPIGETASKNFMAIAHHHKWGDEELFELLTSYRVNHPKDIPRGKYEEIVQKIKAGPKKKA